MFSAPIDRVNVGGGPVVEQSAGFVGWLTNLFLVPVQFFVWSFGDLFNFVCKLH
jgi:hypothetical protein